MCQIGVFSRWLVVVKGLGMSDWSPIRRGPVHVRGFRDEERQILSVEVALSTNPPSEWKEFFADPTTVEVEMQPEVRQAIVLIQVPYDDLELHVEEVERRITHAIRTLAPDRPRLKLRTNE